MSNGAVAQLVARGAQDLHITGSLRSHFSIQDLKHIQIFHILIRFKLLKET